VAILKLVAPTKGWAASDAFNYHFPVINYFISHGFDGQYPNLLAMYPGMHLFFAAVARAFGLDSLAFDGIDAFLIQSIWGIAFLALSYWMLVRLCRTATQVAATSLVVFSSSYILLPWLWPTTDLGTLVFFLGMLAAMQLAETNPSAARLFASVCAVGAVLFRQSSATLGAAILLASQGRFASIGAGSGEIKLKGLLADALPLVCSAITVGLIVWHWNGLVPPGFGKHQAHGVNLIEAVHIVALTGLIGWPFMLTVNRLVVRDPRTLWILLIYESTI
jgi:hypothetical protein